MALGPKAPTPPLRPSAGHAGPGHTHDDVIISFWCIIFVIYTNQSFWVYPSPLRWIARESANPSPTQRAPASWRLNVLRANRIINICIYIFSRANLCSHFGSFGDSLLSPTCGRLRLPRLRGHHVRRGVPHRIKLLQRQCWSGVSISLSHCFRDCGRNINQTRYKPAHIADSRYDFARLL